MRTISDWVKLIQQGRHVVGLEMATIERWSVFEFFLNQAIEMNINCYYWNLGYAHWQQLIAGEQVRLNSTKLPSEPLNSQTVLPYFCQGIQRSGIYLIDDLIAYADYQFSVQQKEAQIQNILDYLKNSQLSVYLVFLGNVVQFTSRLSAEIPVLKVPLPSEMQVQEILLQTQAKSSVLANVGNNEISWKRLIVACTGLPRGEIELALNTYERFSDSVNQLADLILQHKNQQFRGLGLEFIAEPDVSTAGGLDLLQQFLYSKVVKLNEPSAKNYNLRPPRGMLLMGPPGTGKSLCAKLTAKALGYSLLGLSWGNVLGADNPDYTLGKILEVADTLDKCVLLADDFDKGFTGWETGGVSRRLSQRLLTWMQEHTSHVMMVATVNRIQLLPSEVKRRFDDGGIWFFDLPSEGALYEIFMIHLSKYYPFQFDKDTDKSPWTDRQWYRLLKQYKGCTPVEVANAVQRCAIDFYCNLNDEQRTQSEMKPTIVIEELFEQLNQFQKASVRDSEDIHKIRNMAYYARPAASLDQSKFALPSQELFEYRRSQFE